MKEGVPAYAGSMKQLAAVSANKKATDTYAGASIYRLETSSMDTSLRNPCTTIGLVGSSEWICFPDAPPDLAEPSVAAPWLLPVVLRGCPAATSVTYGYSAVTRLPPI